MEDAMPDATTLAPVIHEGYGRLRFAG
jgi:hypothetical protein